MTAAESLDRTIRLMRDDLHADVPEEELLEALLSTRVLLVADKVCLRTHSGRVALAATAELVARAGAEVYVVAPEVDLSALAPPIMGDKLLAGLLELGTDLIPGVEIRTGSPAVDPDIAILFGGSSWSGRAGVILGVGASDWSAFVTSVGPPAPWEAGEWPLGGLAAAALASAEAYKASMRKLWRYASCPDVFADRFRAACNGYLRLAQDPLKGEKRLGQFDCVSAGAISQAALYCLAQIPDVSGICRAIEAERSDQTNLNRYMLLRRSRVGTLKGLDLEQQSLGIQVSAVPERFYSLRDSQIGSFAPRVVVGVDDIAARWAVQRDMPTWLSVGATSHYLGVASFHAEGLPCAGCLHPRDSLDDDPIPTAAFVSMRAGLEVAALLLRDVAGDGLLAQEQKLLAFTLRPEKGTRRFGVSFRADCPVRCVGAARAA